MRGHRVLALAVLATAVLVSASFGATSATGRSQAAAGSITIAIGSEPTFSNSIGVLLGKKTRPPA